MTGLILSRRRLMQGGLTLAGLGLLSGCGRLPWPGQPRMAPIGVLSTGSASSDAVNLAAFRQGLGELGYVEGQTVAIEPRYAEGKEAALPALMAELMAWQADVLLTSSNLAAQAARRATDTLPIVS